MKAKVLRAFATVNQRFEEGDKVSIEEVGEALFYACTDAEKPKGYKGLTDEKPEKAKKAD